MSEIPASSKKYRTEAPRIFEYEEHSKMLTYYEGVLRRLVRVEIAFEQDNGRIQYAIPRNSISHMIVVDNNLEMLRQEKGEITGGGLEIPCRQNSTNY